MLLNIFLEHMMLETLNNLNTTVLIGECLLSNLLFADDFDLMAGAELEPQDHSTKLERISRSYGMNSKNLVYSYKERGTTSHHHLGPCQ